MAKHSKGAARRSKRDLKDLTPPFTSEENAAAVRIVSGNVSYMDGAALKRPFHFPERAYRKLGIILAAALVLGIAMAILFNRNVVYSDNRVSEQVESIINRGVDPEIPLMSEYILLDDDEIISALEEAGFTYVDMAEYGTSSDTSLDIIKLPSDMTVEEADGAFTEGISSLDSETAAKLLSAYWRLTTVRGSGTTVTVKFADFDSTSATTAVAAAVEAQGLGETTLGDSGVDDNGNTYQEGTVEIDGTEYNWTVSACNINDVYDVAGLPETGQYVGVKIYT